MGIGFQVSPLSRIIFVDWAEIPASPDVGAFPFVLPEARVTPWQEIEGRLQSPSRAEIVAWRAELSRKYERQLREPIDWDENSSFVGSRDVSSHALVLLGHVANTLDQKGERGAAEVLFGLPDIPRKELADGGAAVRRAGRQIGFPQLLSGVDCWLPIPHELNIDEPDWAGHIQRFGSVFMLAREVHSVRAFIREADPEASAWGADRPWGEPPTVLAKAWQCADALAELSAMAIENRLPMWTTG